MFIDLLNVTNFAKHFTADKPFLLLPGKVIIFPFIYITYEINRCEWKKQSELVHMQTLGQVS